jgi:hypothetical protein
MAMNFVRILLLTQLAFGISTYFADEFLGKLSDNPYDPDSTSNAYDRYGSEYSTDSINNPYGAGNPYRYDSPTNPYGGGLSIYGDDD